MSNPIQTTVDKFVGNSLFVIAKHQFTNRLPCSVSGACRGAGLADFCDEDGHAGAPSGGAAAGRPVRHGHLAVRPRLLHPAPPPEDHRGGALRHRRRGRVRADGEGAATCRVATAAVCFEFVWVVCLFFCMMLCYQCVQLFTHSLTHSLTHLPIDPHTYVIYSVIYLFIYLFIYSFIHLFILFSFIHPFISNFFGRSTVCLFFY